MAHVVLPAPFCFVQEEVKRWLDNNTANQLMSHIPPAAGGSTAHPSAFDLSSPHVTFLDKDTARVCRATAVSSVKSLPLDMLQHERPYTSDRPATAGAAVGHSPPMRRSSSPALRGSGRLQQDQQQWVQPPNRSSGTQRAQGLEGSTDMSGDAVGIAVGADAVAEAVRIQLKALSRGTAASETLVQ